MTTAIIKAIRTALLGDSAITALLGGDYVFMSEIMQTNQFPSITIKLSSESSKRRVGYFAIKKRDNGDILACDIWSKSSRYQTYQIADRIDVVLISADVSGTRSWTKIGSGGDMYEADTKIYHKPMRYSFEYTITDS